MSLAKNSATETLLRRAASQAVCIARQNTRCVFTDQHHARAQDAALTMDMPAAESVQSAPVTQKQKTIDDLDGPEGYPIVGNLLKYFRKENRGKMHEVQRRQHAKYGKLFKEQFGPVTNLCIGDPKYVEEVFRSEGKYPNRPPFEAWVMYKAMRNRSKGLITAQGEEWLKIRTMFNKRLLKPTAVRHHVQDLSTISEELAAKLKTVRDRHDADNTIPNILYTLSAWAIESVGQVLIDKRFGCLRADLSPTMTNFVDSIQVMFESSHQLIAFCNIHKKLNTKPWKQHVNSWDSIIEIAKDILDSKRGEIQNKLAQSEDRVDNITFLEHMLANRDLNMEEVYTNMTELLLAGVDTTSNTMAIALYLLSRNPQVQETLHKEVSGLNVGPEGLTQEHLQNMPYVKAVVKEVLRMYPVIPINARVLEKDTVIDGYVIPKKTIVMLNAYAMCRDSNEFNKPDEFIPERWLRNEIREFSPFTSLPFGFGARGCAGRRVAEPMLYLALANMSRSFTLEPTENSSDIEPFVRTILSLGNDLPVKFYDR